MRGGKPGVIPRLKLSRRDPVDYFNPIGTVAKMTPEQGAGPPRGLNNGRAAMLGIFGLVSAEKGCFVPGLSSLPLPQYSGEFMEPFSVGETWTYFTG